MTKETLVPKYSWSKWILAVLVGIPAVAGAYYFMRRSNQKISGSDQNGTCKPKKKTVTKDDVSEVKEVNNKLEELPLERSMKLKNSGNTFYKTGQYNDAIRCYTEAISMCPSNETTHLATLYQNRAAAYDVLNETEKIVEDCTAALKLKPDYVKALSRRYKAAEKLGKFRQALEDVTAVCLLENFNNMETLTAADRILKVIGMEEAEKYMKNRSIVLPSDYFIKAYFSSFAQDPVMLDLPTNAAEEAPLLRGIEKAKRALLEEKYSEITEACTEEVDNPSSQKAKEHALLLRASLYILTWQIQEAMTDLNFLIDNSSDIKVKTNALLKRACLSMQTEEVDKAMADFDIAASIDPTNPDVPHQKAQMYLLGEKLEEAVEEFRKAIELNPSSGLVLVQKLYAEYRLGVSKNDMSVAQMAINCLQNAIIKFPNTPEGYMLLAQVYNDSQQYEKAEATFDQGIKSDAKNASILVHKGLLYLQWKGDVEKASELMEKSIEVDPKCEFAYETLASVEVQKGNLMRAVTLFEKALPLAKSMKQAIHILSLKAAAQAQMVVISQSLVPEHRLF